MIHNGYPRGTLHPFRGSNQSDATVSAPHFGAPAGQKPAAGRNEHACHIVSGIRVRVRAHRRGNGPPGAVADQASGPAGPRPCVGGLDLVVATREQS